MNLCFGDVNAMGDDGSDGMLRAHQQRRQRPTEVAEQRAEWQQPRTRAQKPSRLCASGANLRARLRFASLGAWLWPPSRTALSQLVECGSNEQLAIIRTLLPG